jgi:hypothetical protein
MIQARTWAAHAKKGLEIFSFKKRLGWSWLSKNVQKRNDSSKKNRTRNGGG